MAHFIVTFRIESNSSYQSRYESFMKKAYELAGGSPKTWEETTSFLSFQATGSADSIRDSLYLGSEFNAIWDMMVVIDLDARKKATKGDVKYLSTLTSNLGF
ncbi:hypothetical protein [Comamonas sp. B21-038]|uniref:hypothetical protein n=1 Tax=Comamonas sp. B21-038 TaxID=2918299 RepID=UPI001EFC1075|nr:hypothetical protein [Comamonas sp. B21-038]ULR87388.1 hypothetical protein MJ205_13025 [Comamonas sp. B21-038]